MSSKSEWEDFSQMNDFISAKAMIFLSVTLALITQTMAQIVEPSAWLNYQMLAFIMSTNLAAVILAIFCSTLCRTYFCQYSKSIYSRVLSWNCYFSQFL